MNKRIYQGAVYQGFPETQKITGLSRRALQKGLDSGIYPYIKSGTRTLFNIPALLDILDAQSRNSEAMQ